MMFCENSPLSLPCHHLTWETILRIRHLPAPGCAQYAQGFSDGWAQHNSLCTGQSSAPSAQNFHPSCSTTFVGTLDNAQYAAPQRPIVKAEPGMSSRLIPRRPQALDLSKVKRYPQPPSIISPRPQRPAQDTAALRSLKLRDLPPEELKKCHIEVSDSSDSDAMDEDQEPTSYDYPPSVSPSAISNAASSPFSPQDSFPMTPQDSFLNHPHESIGCAASSSHFVDDAFDFDSIFPDTRIPIESKDSTQYPVDPPIFPDIPADLELPPLSAADIDFLMQCGLPEDWVRASAEAHNSRCPPSTQDPSMFSEACTYDASYHSAPLSSSSYQYTPK